MTSRSPHRLAEVERLYHEARERDAATREAFLADACGGDTGLRADVEALLRFDTAAERFLTRPALEQSARTLAGSPAGALAGRQIHGYEIQSLLGSGGMGEVYLARDLRLGREVALKILQPVVAADPTYRRRFEDEARSASVINHPNIVTIYGVGEQGEIAYIAMERVHGRTLREIIASADLAVPAVLDLAVQLADALAVAHDNGIVHRDLKPDNVMVTPEGRLKVLDFGIAKRDGVVEPSRTMADHTMADAAAGLPDPTQAGTILGTLGYMSPEQAEGRRAGPQSDQFSFGTILYELLTGRRAFNRSSRAETLEAIRHAEPEPLQSLNANASPPLRRLVERCLTKDPAKRYARSRDLAAEVRDIRDGLSGGRLSRREIIRAGAAAGGVLIAAAGLGWWIWPRAPRVRSLAILPFENSAHNPDLDPLCDGLTGHLIRSLVLPTIRVMPQSLVSNFPRSGLEARAFGREIKADAVLTGAVTMRGDALTIWAALTEVESGNQIWSNSYTKAASDLQAAQQAIVTEIVRDGIRLQLSDADRERLTRRDTANAEAYEWYLKGTYLHEREDDLGEQGARACLQRAVALDPKFARAYAALAATYTASVINGYELPFEAWAASQKATRDALQHDPDLPDAHAQNAAYEFFYNWDWAGAEREWALAMRSRYAEIYPPIRVQRALQQWALGRTSEAVRLIGEVREADPLSPLFVGKEAHYLLQDGNLELSAKMYDRALRSVLDVDKEDYWYGLAEVRREHGDFDDAIMIRRRLDGGRGDDALDALLATAHGATGYQQIERQVARLDLDQLEKLAGSGAYVAPIRRARLHAMLGDADAAFRQLDEAFDIRDPGVVMIRADHAWGPLRADPRFVAAVARLHLP